jgi:hypothetical protein
VNRAAATATVEKLNSPFNLVEQEKKGEEGRERQEEGTDPGFWDCRG